MVGGLVEQEHIGLLEQQTAEGHTATFAAGECLDGLVVGRTLESIHSAFELGVDIPGVGSVELILKFGLTGDECVHLVGVFKYIRVSESFVDFFEFGKEVHDGLHSFAHDLDYGFARVEVRLLLEIADRVSRRENDFAAVVFVDAGYDLEKR